MMKIFSALIALLFFAIKPSFASYDSAYQDYSFNYSKYREAHNSYQVAKSSYSTYRTLIAQADAVDKLRQVIQARDKLIMSYYDLLQEKLLITENIPNDSRDTFFKMKESEKTWMDEHQKKVDAASTLEDLNVVASDLENRYPQMDFETKQAVGMVFLAKEGSFSSRWDRLASDLSDKLKEINEDTSTEQRGIVSAKNKKEQAVRKIDAAKLIFYPKDNRIDLFSGQQRLTEANQYLREGISYLLDVIKFITG